MPKNITTPPQTIETCYQKPLLGKGRNPIMHALVAPNGINVMGANYYAYVPEPHQTLPFLPTLWLPALANQNPLLDYINSKKEVNPTHGIWQLSNERKNMFAAMFTGLHAALLRCSNPNLQNINDTQTQLFLTLSGQFQDLNFSNPHILTDPKIKVKPAVIYAKSPFNGYAAYIIGQAYN